MALHHVVSGEVVDLQALGNGIASAKTKALVKTSRFEAVRLIVHRGRELPTHSVPGPITLHCLEGRVLLGLVDTTRELAAGQWIYLDGGVDHSVKGLEDSSLLLTILFDH